MVYRAINRSSWNSFLGSLSIKIQSSRYLFDQYVWISMIMSGIPSFMTGLSLKYTSNEPPVSWCANISLSYRVLYHMDYRTTARCLSNSVLSPVPRLVISPLKKYFLQRSLFFRLAWPDLPYLRMLIVRAPTRILWFCGWTSLIILYIKP